MSEENKIPSWKSDFPIKKEEASYVSRRQFLKLLTLFSGTVALANGIIPVAKLLNSSKKFSNKSFVCKASEVPVGGMRIFYINEDHRNPYMLIRMAEEKWRAYSNKCTHLSCGVIYRHDMGKIECPCHHGYFDPNDGSVLQGPPPRPLPSLKVELIDEDVYVQHV